MVDIDEGLVMPPDIAAAVIKVMGAIGTLGKDRENKFDSYNYASIDDFIKFVRGHCHDAGLFIIPQEAAEPRLEGMKKKNGDPLMMWWSRFAFYLAHTSGATCGPIYKTVMVQAAGAQSAGSAQSYAMKQLMRGLFQIPTGDKDDPDNSPTNDISRAEDTQTDLQKEATKIRDALMKAKTVDALAEAWEVNSIRLEEIKAASQTAYKHLRGVYEKKEAEFKQ